MLTIPTAPSDVPKAKVASPETIRPHLGLAGQG